MDSSHFVGRVGGLAVALGIGTALFSGCAVAAADRADSGGTGSADSSAGDPPARGAGRTGPARAAKSPPAQARNTGESPSSPVARPATPRAAASALSPAVLGADDTTPVPSADGPRRRSGAPADRVRSPGRDAVMSGAADAIPPGAEPMSPAAASPPVAPTAAVATNPNPGPFGTASPGPAAATAPAAALSALANPDALAPHPSAQVLGITALSTTVTFLASVYQQFSIAFYLGAPKPTLNQTVDFNGSRLVPGSTELVTSFYGPWTYGPGGLNMVQGQQRYDVVDPVTEQTAGSFGALVSTGTPFGLGEYVELIVTSADGDVGTAAGQVPPVGSVIAGMKLIGRFGWSYSATPSPSGDVISAALTTPFGDIPIRFFERFDAALGIADRTVDNRPVDLGNGYFIVPSDPEGETFTGTSGFLPLFQTVQAREVFDVRDSAGGTVGSFEGEVTTTWDALGAYTQAILVTDSDGDNVGTGVGQVPPTGTVYNVSYAGRDASYVLSTSMPSPSGDVVSLIEGEDGKVSNVLTFPVNRLNAAAPPPVRRLPIAGGYALLPTSDLIPSGVNGLPPRDVQIQGYRQFGVYDPDGVQRGSFDAIVTDQWDLLGFHSHAIMVTGVSDGTAGTAPGEIPPVGSVFNYVYFGDAGFGTSYWSLPSPDGTEIAYKILTPLVDIPTWSRYDASAGLESVTLFNPFLVV